MSQMPPATPPMNYSTPPNKPAGLAIAAMIVGIVSIFPGCCLTAYGMIVLGLAAVIMAVIARKSAAAGTGGGGGMATAGLVTGAIGLVVGIILLCVILFGGPAINNRLQRFLQQKQQEIQQKQTEMEQQQRQSEPATQPTTMP